MNSSSQISSIHKSNSSHNFFSNGTEVETDFPNMSPVTYIIHILLNFPTSFYVIWLIVRGTGNGLVAEISILNTFACEIVLCVQSLLNFIMLSRWFLLIYDEEITSKLVDFLCGFDITGRPLFQCLICVERYLAVVHPVTFLKYKPLRYRLMCSVIAWGTCFGSCIFNFIAFNFLFFRLFFIFYIGQFFIFLSIQLFCCVAVLRALKQSGPGERGRERKEENHIKRKAFYLILITTVGMVFTYGSQISLQLADWLTGFSYSNILKPVHFVFFLFAGLVQPLLFLYRVGKLNFK